MSNSTSTPRRRAAGLRQINLGFGQASALRLRLLEAERLTGRSPTRIAREVLEDYLDLWVSMRLQERAVIAEAKRQVERRKPA